MLLRASRMVCEPCGLGMVVGREAVTGGLGPAQGPLGRLPSSPCVLCDAWLMPHRRSPVSGVARRLGAGTYRAPNMMPPLTQLVLYLRTSSGTSGRMVDQMRLKIDAHPDCSYSYTLTILRPPRKAVHTIRFILST